MQQSDLIITDENNTLEEIFTPTEPIQNNSQPRDSKNSIENRVMEAYRKNMLKETKKQIKKKPIKKVEEKIKKVEQPTKKRENKVDKEKKILKILKYQNSQRFGSRIKKDLGIKYTRVQLLKCSVENLDSILFRIRNYLNTSNMDHVFEHLARYAAKGYEDVVSQFVDIDGFSDLLLQNPAFWDAYSIWQIEREMPELPPSIQMLYIVSSTTYIAYLQNKVKNVNKQHIIEQNKNKENKNKENKNKENKNKKMRIGDVI